MERDKKTKHKHSLHFVFLNTNTGESYVSDFSIRDRFFKAHLKAADVRCRRAGPVPAYLHEPAADHGRGLVEQMGHTNENMIRQHYGSG